MSSDPSKQFQHILEAARADPHVLGLFLGGSRAKAFDHEFSDYDICVIMADDAPEPTHEHYLRLNSERFDVWIYPFSQFRNESAWDGPEFWDRYSYDHASALIDKCDGQIQRLIDQRGRIPAEQRDPWLRGCLDGYINSVYRSLKCLRKGNRLGARLEAAESITRLLDVLFAYEMRHRPFHGYLERELRKYPLGSLPISADELLAKIDAITASADRATQQELLAMADALLRPAGFGDVFDSWGENYPWMRSFKG
ncbi:MAG TPA: nucleotidyltransferase domain-containing protein [Roseiflexaceae bacterium]|nr:nucleotidyltransferase domain-containing protein [Roseiflexaceae bacterium]